MMVRFSSGGDSTLLSLNYLFGLKFCYSLLYYLLITSVFLFSISFKERDTTVIKQNHFYTRYSFDFKNIITMSLCYPSSNVHIRALLLSALALTPRLLGSAVLLV